MPNITTELSHLSYFLCMTQPLKQMHLGQMPRQTVGKFAEAVEWMLRECKTPLSDNQATELEALLAPFSDYMAEIEDLGVIDGRSAAKSQIPGKTWTEFARENGDEIPINSLKSLAGILQATQPDPPLRHRDQKPTDSDEN